MRTFEWEMFHLNCLCDCKKFKRIEKNDRKTREMTAPERLPLCKGSCHRKLTEGLAVKHLFHIKYHFFTIPPARQAAPPPFAQGRLLYAHI